MRRRRARWIRADVRLWGMCRAGLAAPARRSEPLGGAAKRRAAARPGPPDSSRRSTASLDETTRDGDDDEARGRFKTKTRVMS